LRDKEEVWKADKFNFAYGETRGEYHMQLQGSTADESRFSTGCLKSCIHSIDEIRVTHLRQCENIGSAKCLIGQARFLNHNTYTLFGSRTGNRK